MLRASASTIKFTPILGVADAPDASNRGGHRPVAHLLTIDGITILLDAGWTSTFDSQVLKDLAPVLDRVDCVIISSPDMAHCGAVPFLHKRLRPGAQIYATFPTSRLALYEVTSEFNSRFPNEHTFDDVLIPTENGRKPFHLTVDDIYAAFKSIKEPRGGRVQVQPVEAYAAQEAVCLEPHIGGRVLGGTVWRITYQTDDIVYAPDFSLKKSFLLKPFDVPGSANILIASGGNEQSIDGTVSGPGASAGASHSAANASGAAASAAAAIEEKLLARIKASVRRNANVLLPVDACGRGIELLATLSNAFKTEGLNYSIVFAFPKANEVLQRIKTMTEQVKEHLFVENDDVFDPARIVAARTVEEVLAVDDPMIVVAHGLSCEWGLAGELMKHFLHAEEAAIIFTGGAPQPNTLGAALYNQVLHEREPIKPLLRDGYVAQGIRRVRLEGAELDAFLNEQQQRNEDEARGAKVHEAHFVDGSNDGFGDDDDDVDDDDGESGVTAGAAAETPRRRDSAAAAAVVVGGGSAAQSGARAMAVTNLFLPPHLEAALATQRQRGTAIQFPVVKSAVATSTKADSSAVYGVPLAEWERATMRKNAPMRIFNDSAPELNIMNDVRAADSHPARIETFELRVPANQTLPCYVGVLDMSGRPGAETLRHLLKTHFMTLRALVVFGGTASDARVLANYCNSSGLRCANAVHIARSHQSVELAREVFAFDVRLDPQLQVPMKRVQETRGSGQWEIGFVRGVVEVHRQQRTGGAGGGESALPQKRTRLEGGGPHHDADEAAVTTEDTEDNLIVLKPIPEGRNDAAARQLETLGFVTGSSFVGSLELAKLRDVLRNDLHVPAEFYTGAPLLSVRNGSVLVRRGEAGEVAVEALASTDQFDVRRKVYDSFSYSV